MIDESEIARLRAMLHTAVALKLFAQKECDELRSANIAASEQLRILAERITIIEKERDAARASVVATNAMLDALGDRL